MALDRLTRWLGRRPEPPPDLASALDDLARLAAARPELDVPARTLGRVLAAAFLTGMDDAPPSLDPAGLLDGTPAFRKVAPDFSRGTLKARALAIVEALIEGDVPAGPLRDAIRRGSIDVAGWASEALAGRPEIVAAGSERLGIDPQLAASVLRLALLPTLSRIVAASGPIAAGPLRGECPFCGSAPLLAELRGLEREVRLRCGLCAGDWPGGRIRCPSCGEDDHRRLATRYVEGRGDRDRLSACDSCGARLKLLGTLAPLSPPALIVADLATIHLDLIDVPEAPTSPEGP